MTLMTIISNLLSLLSFLPLCRLWAFPYQVFENEKKTEINGERVKVSDKKLSCPQSRIAISNLSINSFIPMRLLVKAAITMGKLAQNASNNGSGNVGSGSRGHGSPSGTQPNC